VAIRAVFDTNVLLSALFSLTGPPFRCLALARTGAVESITCQTILDEFTEKLVEKFGFEPEKARHAAQEVRDISQMVSVPGMLKIVAVDPDDDVIVECALTGHAAYVVTGDRHLLQLGQHAGIIMVRPAKFIELVVADEQNPPSR
jgi:uncharacterized protein